MRTEFINNRRRIKFLGFKWNPPYANGYTDTRIYFSNSGRRPIQIRNIYATTSTRKRLDPDIFDGITETLNDGEDMAKNIDFPFRVKEEEIRSVVVVDTQNKSYRCYLYKGKIKNWWIVQFLLLRDKVLKMLNCNHDNQKEIQRPD